MKNLDFLNDKSKKISEYTPFPQEVSKIVLLYSTEPPINFYFESKNDNKDFNKVHFHKRYIENKNLFYDNTLYVECENFKIEIDKNPKNCCYQIKTTVFLNIPFISYFIKIPSSQTIDYWSIENFENVNYSEQDCKLNRSNFISDEKNGPITFKPVYIIDYKLNENNKFIYWNPFLHLTNETDFYNLTLIGYKRSLELRSRAIYEYLGVSSNSIFKTIIGRSINLFFYEFILKKLIGYCISKLPFNSIFQQNPYIGKVRYLLYLPLIYNSYNMVVIPKRYKVWGKSYIEDYLLRNHPTIINKYINLSSDLDLR